MAGGVTVTETLRLTVTKGEPLPLYCTVTVALGEPGVREVASTMTWKLLPSKPETVHQVWLD